MKMDLTIENAIKVLRDRSLWPKTFPGWDYSNHRTCLIGLVGHCWPEKFPRGAFGYEVAKALGMLVPAHDNPTITDTIFYGLAGPTATLEDMRKITPEQVAEALQEYLNGRHVS